MWRRKLPEGGIGMPAVVEGALLVTSTRYGLFLFSPLDGALIDGIETGSGFEHVGGGVRSSRLRQGRTAGSSSAST